jgi:hypothetical protein
MKVLDTILAQEEAPKISYALIVSLHLNEFQVTNEQGK